MYIYIPQYLDITISRFRIQRGEEHDITMVISCFRVLGYGWLKKHEHIGPDPIPTLERIVWELSFPQEKPGKRRTWYHDITLCLFATTLLSFSRPKCVDIAIISGPQVITNPPTNIVYLLVNCQSVAPYRICHLPIPRRTFPNRGKGIIYILWHTVTFPRHYL